MIEILDKRTLAFVEFLNKNYGAADKESVKLSILHGYDAVASDESGNTGFAVYVPPMKVIMLPTDIPEQVAEMDDEELKRDFVIHNLAHEYAHYLQEMGALDGWDNEESVEKIADEFADRAVKEFNETWSNQSKEVNDLVKEKLEQAGNEIKMAFYYEFDEIIPSIMADKIDEIINKKIMEGGGNG